MRVQRRHDSPRILGVDVLKPEDLQFLQEKSAVPALKKLRDSHHALARYIASGMKQGEAAAICGFSASRVSVHMADPGFQELVAYYRGIITEEWARNQDEYHRLIYTNGLKALRQISDTLDEADETGEPIPLRHLIPLSESSLDRVGYGKRSTTVNVNVDFAARLEAARRRSGPVIDAVAASDEEAA